jgi:UDP-N-acetylglucosamine--N-acetylmuramyl-(pentapeptide) pyrophosphoryl-undecaprenol N-acetylglucosamine transferase
LIPLPQAIDDHQTRNAEVLAASGAAVLLAQQEATPERVADLLEAWIASPLSVATMSRAALGLSRADATDRVVTVIKEIAHASI